MVTVNDILQYIEAFAPASLKMDWDNVGLLCGSRSTAVTKVLVALDPFEGVCREAAEWGAELLVTHHPLIFQPLPRITDETSIGRTIQILCANGISAVNAHTNLDCAPGGVNDTLAATLGLTDVQTVPGDNEQLLRMGQVETQTLENFLGHVKTALGCKGLRYISGGKPVGKVAVGGGSCGGAIPVVAAAGCDTFVTADIKYNQFRTAYELGLNLIDAGHFHTENPAMPVVAAKLRQAFPGVDVVFSENHDDQMNFFV